MEKEYYLGIDGGQSGSRCLVIDAGGTIVGMGKAGKIDHVLAPGGRERLREAFQTAIAGATGGEKIQFKAAFLGLSGVVAGGCLEQTVREAVAGVFHTEHLFVDNDGIIAWGGALSLRPGIIAIAGSGSLVLGVDHKGRMERAAGWGYLFGDEAGAFGIAVSAIKGELRKADEGYPPSALTEQIVAHFGVRELWEIVKGFYAGDFDRAKIGGLTPVLAAAARNGSGDLMEIFRDAATVLADQIDMVARRLDWKGSSILWSPIGGVFRSGDLFTEPLVGRLKSISTFDFTMVPPEYPPVVGAALLAFQKSGRAFPNGFFGRLRESFRPLAD